VHGRPVPPSSPDASTRTGRVIAIVGPTGVGKTAIAEEVALRVGGEIVTADSMQVYRGMDIGTAKPASAERAVAHHLIDVVDPGEPFSAALYQREARAAMDAIFARDAVPVLCGGTGLYVRAALDDWDFPGGDQVANPVRARYESYAVQHGAQALHALLAERDPASAELVHANNVRRVVRALEMHERGASYAHQQGRFAERRSVYAAHIVGLTMERAVLYERIDRRVDAMMAAGLLEEVERLLAEGLREALTAAQAIGYKELVQALDGDISLDEAVESIKRSSRRYAKRQLTWFRADPRTVWVPVDGLTPATAASAVLEAIRWSERASSRA